MISGWLALVTLLAFMGGLFTVAYYGDKAYERVGVLRVRQAVYLLGCCTYFSASSFFGFIAVASKTGLGVFTAFAGPVIVFILFSTVIGRMARLAKAQNITSITDFAAISYGRSAPMAASVTTIALVCGIPYLAFQIKSVSQAVLFFTDGPHDTALAVLSPCMPVLVAALLAVLTIALAPHRLDGVERQKRMVLALAVGALVKLVSFALIGAYATWGIMGGIGVVADLATHTPRIQAVVTPPHIGSPEVKTVLTSFMLILFTPHMFHLLVIENRNPNEVRRVATWFMPLVAVSIIVLTLPIMIAGLWIFPDGAIDRALTLFALPIQAGSTTMTVLALTCAYAASAAPVVIASSVLATMVSNDLVMPILLHPCFSWSARDKTAIGPRIVMIRRLTILVVLGVSTLYALHQSASELRRDLLACASLFAQIVPACIFALFWRKATKNGALAGLAAGFAVWLYVSFAPASAPGSAFAAGLVAAGPFGLGFLRPTALFGLPFDGPTLTVVSSLATNVITFVAVSLTETSRLGVRLSASGGALHHKAFEQPSAAGGSDGIAGAPRGGGVTVGELKEAVAHYLGWIETCWVFEPYFAGRGVTFDPGRLADRQDLRFGENLLATAIGAASSRLVVSLLVQQQSISRDEVLRLVDDVSAEIQDSRDILYEAIASSQQGMVLYDGERRAVMWNQALVEMFDFPTEIMRFGVTFDELARFNAERGLYGPGQVEDLAQVRIVSVRDTTSVKRLQAGNKVLDVRSVRTPDNGRFIIYIDVTEEAVTERQLEAENETLERRVRERTEELERLNAVLEKAKADAEEANISKTRFLAAASHDLLQPLNAARLYATSLKERVRERAAPDDSLMLALNVEDSLEAVEDILTTLLDMSRLDSGVMLPEITLFRLDVVVRQLRLEFEPIAKAKGLRLSFVPSTLSVRSDRRLLRRLLQNLVSNAVKYTVEGRVIVGVRLEAGHARIEIWDTGLGIPKSKQSDIFREFERLPSAVRAAPGVGLGLSIVQRIGRVLDHDVSVRSKPGIGSVFSLRVPHAIGAPALRMPLSQTLPSRQRSLAGLVIVAIDNEPAILRGMEALLGGWDCAIVAATDANHAATSLAARGLTPDVVIADYHLDTNDGLVAIKTLQDCYGPCKAVLVTADRSPLVRDRAHRADVRVLNKPLKPAALRSLLSQWRLVKNAAE